MAVVPGTADAELLARPLRDISDVERIERVPLENRLPIVDFHQRIALALAARKGGDTAMHFIADGDVDGIDHETSFATLRQNIDRTASLLRSRHINRSDVVAILLPTMPALYWTIIGAMVQAVPFPLNWMLEPRYLLCLLTESKVKAVIALGPTPGFKIWESVMSIRDKLPSGMPVWSVAAPGSVVLPEFDLDLQLAGQGQTKLDSPRPPPVHDGSDVAAYVHSGGTTGLPKIVKLSHQNISYRHWSLQLAMQMTLGEVVLQDTPIFHVGGLAGRCLPMLASGASLVIPSLMGARDRRYIANYWKFIARFRVTRLSGVPTTFSVLIKSPPQGEDLSSLKRNFITGSTSLPISVRREFERVSGVRILNSYGLTENTASVAIEPRDGQSREGSSGVAVPYTRVRVNSLEDTGTTSASCGPNQTGMIQVSGPGVTLGYLNDSHTQASRTADGWLITGDLGRIDSDGNLFVTGRAKDIIIRGGHNIDPGIIEDALLQSPEVLLAAAVGKPDAHAGELPVAYVQLVAGSRITEAALLACVAARIPERAAVPKEIFVVDKIPLTDAGKPAKVVLRQDAAERTFRSALSQIPCLSSTPHSLRVKAGPHPVHGTLITIFLTRPEPLDRTTLVAAIEELMSRYSFAYVVTASGE
ncbi:MAG TPA: AMP-binding protein [Gemmatimonadaceae bacterium]|nr:AMP-binding protein [Gemmatimonadaceae bacterium]